jgi:hypothetical protein
LSSSLKRHLTTDRLSTWPHGLRGCSGPTKLMWPRPAHSCTRRHLCPSGRTHCFFTSKSGLVQDGAQWLRKQANHLQKQRTNPMSPHLQWLIPFLIPLFFWLS